MSKLFLEKEMPHRQVFGILVSLGATTLLLTSCVSAPTPTVDMGTYPKGWPPIRKADGPNCNSMLGAFVASDESTGIDSFRIAAKALLRTEGGISKATKFDLSVWREDPDFFEAKAYDNANKLIEASPVRAKCSSGAISLWTNEFEKKQGNTPGKPVYLDSRAPQHWRYTVSKSIVTFYQTDGYLIVSEARNTCLRDDFESLTPYRRDKGAVHSCENSSHWYRLKKV